MHSERIEDRSWDLASMATEFAISCPPRTESGRGQKFALQRSRSCSFIPQRKSLQNLQFGPASKMNVALEYLDRRARGPSRSWFPLALASLDTAMPAVERIPRAFLSQANCIIASHPSIQICGFAREPRLCNATALIALSGPMTRD